MAMIIFFAVVLYWVMYPGVPDIEGRPPNKKAILTLGHWFARWCCTTAFFPVVILVFLTELPFYTINALIAYTHDKKRSNWKFYCTRFVFYLICWLDARKINKLFEENKDGKPEDLVKTHYEDGNLQVETPYKNGKGEGISKTYYANGNLKSEINYKDGKAVSGYAYDRLGNKIKLNKAHLHNLSKSSHKKRLTLPTV